MRTKIRILSQLDQVDLALLRAEAYARDATMRADPSVTNWNANDDRFINLGAFHHARLVSVFRLEWANNASALRERLAIPSLPMPTAFPAAVGGKAATAADVSHRGLSSLLRYHALRIVRSWDCQLMTGTMVRSAPRVASMKAMGYDFYATSGRWSAMIRSDEPIYIASLPRERFPQAMTYLEARLGPLLASYRCEFDVPASPKRPSPTLFRSVEP